MIFSYENNFNQQVFDDLYILKKKKVKINIFFNSFLYDFYIQGKIG